jgi:hypothetical protein
MNEESTGGYLCFVSFCFISFRFFRYISFRYILLRFVTFRFVSFLFVRFHFVSHFTGTLRYFPHSCLITRFVSRVKWQVPPNETKCSEKNEKLNMAWRLRGFIIYWLSKFRRLKGFLVLYYNDYPNLSYLSIFYISFRFIRFRFVSISFRTLQVPSTGLWLWQMEHIHGQLWHK